MTSAISLPKLAILVLLHYSCASALIGDPRIFEANGDGIPGQYIVVYRESVENVNNKTDALIEVGGRVMQTFRSTVKAVVVGRLQSKGRVLKKILEDPDVDYIEQDQRIYVTATQDRPPSWGLDRIDQSELPLGRSYEYKYTGAGVNIYVLDTGVNFRHDDLQGRVSCGFDNISLLRNKCRDRNGHGSHVAALAAGTIYGVAKGANVIAVQVLDGYGTGTASGIIAAIDWVAEQKKLDPSKPAVANLSLGGGKSSTENNVIKAAVDAGVVMVVAAGNSNDDACNYSPASAESAITVGSTNRNDQRSSFSNFGPCVDIFAPGSDITSAWWLTRRASRSISGTSMASPHVAGVAALYLEAYPSWTPHQVWDAMRTDATSGAVTNMKSDTSNLFVNTAAIA